MEKLSGFRKSVLVLAGIVACSSISLRALSAQVLGASQINFQFSGMIPVTSTGNATGGDPNVPGSPITEQPSRTGGFQGIYSYQINRWAGVDAGVGLARYTQNFTGSFGASSVQSNCRELMSDFVLHIPVHQSRVHPYLLAGAGALKFNPTTNLNNAAGATSQSRAALIYGGGADFDISKRIGIRADYRGAKFRIPDFRLTALTMDSDTHIAQPSIGIYFKLSGVGKGNK